LAKHGPWRLVEKHPIDRFEIGGMRGGIRHVQGVYRVEYKRRVLGRRRYFEEYKEE
jgi:hypothetical protein